MAITGRWAAGLGQPTVGAAPRPRNARGAVSQVRTAQVETAQVGTAQVGTAQVETEAPANGAAAAATSTVRSHARLIGAYRSTVLGVDLLAGTGAALIGLALRFGSSATVSYVALSALMPLLWLASMAARRGYERRVLGDGAEEYRRLIDASLVLFVLAASASFTLRGELSRGYLFLVLPSALVLSAIGRWAARAWLHRRQARGEGLLRVLVVGLPGPARHMIDQLAGQPWHGLVAAGTCTDVEPKAVLASAREHRADAVAVTSHPGLFGHPLRRLAWALDENDLDLIVSPGIVEVAGPRLSIRPAAGLSLLFLDRPVTNGFRALLKRLMDRTLALILLVVALPLLAAVALAVKVGSPGPVIFRQARIGVDGRAFQMLKIRSMVVDAEARLTELEDENDSSGPTFKMRRDPRVTAVGAVIRRYSIDELPQLWNVVRGDMSLVGPRPPLPSEVDSYDADAMRRLRVRPGMTGLWQVSGRSDLSWEESLRLDLRYVDNWSMALDLQILWRTWRAVIGRSGAY